MEDLEAKLKSYQDFSKATVFDAEGKLITGTCTPTEDEMKTITHVFDDCETTFKMGIVFDGKQYESFRFYPDHKPGLVYGRNMDTDADQSEGICVSRVTNSKDENIFAVITYELPVLSAKAIPQVIEFANEHLAKL